MSDQMISSGASV